MVMESPNIFYEDETFSLIYEPMGDQALIHMYVRSYTHKSLRKWYYETERLKAYLIQEGFKGAFTVSPNPRFVKLFNGKHTTRLTYEGRDYEVFVWDLKSQP